MNKHILFAWEPDDIHSWYILFAWDPLNNRKRFLAFAHNKRRMDEVTNLYLSQGYEWMPEKLKSLL